MGVVCKAEDTKLKRTVALKFLPPEALDDPELRARFLQEAQAAAALNHANVCTIYEVDEERGCRWRALSHDQGHEQNTYSTRIVVVLNFAEELRRLTTEAKSK